MNEVLGAKKRRLEERPNKFCQLNEERLVKLLDLCRFGVQALHCYYSRLLNAIKFATVWSFKKVRHTTDSKAISVICYKAIIFEQMFLFS